MIIENQEEYFSYLDKKEEMLNLRMNDTTSPFSKLFKRTTAGEIEKYVPFIQFPSDMEFKIRAPLDLSLRFWVRLVGGTETVSVYYDLHGYAGACTDYWEIYPDEEEDARRFNNTTESIQEMFNAIRKSLQKLENIKNAT